MTTSSTQSLNTTTQAHLVNQHEHTSSEDGTACCSESLYLNRSLKLKHNNLKHNNLEHSKLAGRDE